MEQTDSKTPEWYEDDEIQKMLNRIEEKKQLESAPEFPEESFEMYSEAPLEFEDMAASLREDLEEVYTLTGTLSRFSPDYPAACRILEKMIRRMGSYCMTKAVLEQKGFEFPALKNLDLKDFYSMVSFNFRKTRAAYHDGKKQQDCADMGLLALECRWVDLAEQLKATGEKIRLIRSGKISADSMLERARMFQGEKGIRRSSSNTRAASGKGRSLPVLGSVARQMIAERKEALKAMKEDMRRIPGIGVFREAQPFRPSKQMLALIRQDEEREAAERRASEREMLEKFRKGEVSMSGTEIPHKAPLPEKKSADNRSMKKSRKQRRKEEAMARMLERDTEEILRRTKEIYGARFEAMKAAKNPSGGS